MYLNFNIFLLFSQKKNVGFPTFLSWKKTTFLLSHKHMLHTLSFPFALSPDITGLETPVWFFVAA